jgi:hypothetical protein
MQQGRGDARLDLRKLDARGKVGRYDFDLGTGFALQCCAQFLKTLTPARDQDEVVAPSSQVLGVGSPDARGGSGYERARLGARTRRVSLP